MSIYARIQSGLVMELIAAPLDENGNPVQMVSMFNAALIDGTISYMTDVTNVSPQPEPLWTATETNGVWAFVAPT